MVLSWWIVFFCAVYVQVSDGLLNSLYCVEIEVAKSTSIQRAKCPSSEGRS